MAYKLTKGDQSNYMVTISFSEEDKKKERGHVIEMFKNYLDIPGFRKGHVPTALVEQKVSPAQIDAEIMEHIVDHAISNVLKENQEIKFIGSPYGFKDEKDGDTTKVTIYLDVYPEVEVKDKNWEKETIKEISSEISEQEVEEGISRLKRMYIDYQDTDEITEGTISKIEIECINEAGENTRGVNVYLGKQEFEESKFWGKTFNGKKKDEVVEIKKSDSLPEELKKKLKEDTVKLKATIKDIKKEILPEFNDETIAKYFGNECKTFEELKDKIKTTMSEEKHTEELVKAIEEYVTKLNEKFFSIEIPKTLIEEEFKARISSLEKKLGGKEKVKEYLESMKDGAKNFFEDIKTKATESLKKFFILMKVSDLLNLGIDWNSNLENLIVEKKLYEYFHPSKETAEKKSEKKSKKSDTSEETEEKSEKKTTKKTKKEDTEDEKKTEKKTRRCAKKED